MEARELREALLGGRNVEVEDENEALSPLVEADRMSLDMDVPEVAFEARTLEFPEA